MPRFDLDAQRGLVCLFGLVALTAEGVAFYFTGKALPDIFTTGFIAMAMGPLASAWAEKYRETKQERETQREPPSTSPADPSTGPTESNEESKG